MKDVVAVVVTYNRLELLKKCMQALVEQSTLCDIMIINNASTDATEQYVHQQQMQYENILYYNTKTNIGGAGGFSFGMKKAVEKGYKYVWVMDDDCIVQENTLTELLKAAEYFEKNGMK